MAYVPGYQHDVFVSYAHGDNRNWIEKFLGHLQRDIKVRLGDEINFWLDEEDLRRDRDFRLEIPQSVRASAVFLMLPSNSYIRSKYCVPEECEAFKKAQHEHRKRFVGAEFMNSHFAFSCPLLPVYKNEHRTIFSGVSDIDFCDEKETFKVGGKKFDESLGRLVNGLETLLRGMRNRATPVFLYPDTPPPELEQACQSLRNELSAQGFRILPERQTNIDGQLRESSLAVFLLGGQFNERARGLTDLARRQNKPWLVWRSPEASDCKDIKQLAFANKFESDLSGQLTLLSGSVSPAKLKEEVFALLRTDTVSQPKSREKPKIYLIYNLKEQADSQNAGSIVLHYDKEFHFDYSDDPGKRSARLMKSDGVLLVWANADSEWCRGELKAMLQTARSRNRGLCVFDPRQSKTTVIDEIRQNTDDVLIAEAFGGFDPAHLEAFFDPIRQNARGAVA